HDLFNETLWAGHPLGRPVLGTVHSITSMHRDQVKRFYRRLYTPAKFVVVAAGNLEHDRVVEHVQQGMETGRVRSEGPSAWRLRGPRPGPNPSGATRVRNRPTGQAHICTGKTGRS